MGAIVTAPLLDPSPPFRWDVEPALRRLDEKALREQVLPHLLRVLGFFDVRHRHGPREEGKDLLAWRRSAIGTHDWVGFVVKAGDLNAQVTSTAGVRTVLHQVEQVLDHEVTDPLTSAQSVVRECWIVTNGAIPGHAIDEIAPTLRRHHLEKAVRWIDLITLARLLNELIEPERLAEMLRLDAREAPAHPERVPNG
jgi:hypothetical protein